MVTAMKEVKQQRIKQVKNDKESVPHQWSFGTNSSVKIVRFPAS